MRLQRILLPKYFSLGPSQNRVVQFSYGMLNEAGLYVRKQYTLLNQSYPKTFYDHFELE